MNYTLNPHQEVPVGVFETYGGSLHFAHVPVRISMGTFDNNATDDDGDVDMCEVGFESWIRSKRKVAIHLNYFFM